jgi:tRNA nucleotidyltransferase (CCA-adding enzyme)
MPDYIYLLEHRLSQVQQNALRTVRDLAREAQMTVFLAGGAVRDLTCGNPVHDLEVIVHGNAMSLKSAVTRAGGKLWGEHAPSRTLYFCFPGNVRIDLGSAYRADHPTPGKPVYHWTSIQEHLRARDFTANAMAISLNEGSYGLLMDPANGVADIELRQLRLVTNYGFLDNPALLIRATRLKARLAFELEERTQTRYENAKGDEVIGYLSEFERSRELEQIGHEEEPLKILEALEAEGWTQHLFPAWTAARADVDKLTALHDLSIELQVQGVHPDVSAAQMQLLTAKLSAKDLAQLKKMMLRPGFVEEWNSLDARATEFAKILLAKDNAAPSATYMLFTTYPAEAVLWLGFTSKQAAVKEKYENFLKVWPQARQRVPYAMMLEMRITPELPGYADLVKSIFLQLIDGGLTTPEETRALLEPHSPPAPPPPVTIKRTRVKKGAEAKAKARIDDDDEDAEDLADDDDDDDLDSLDLSGDDLDLSLGIDHGRPALVGAEGEEDDVFARDTVGDEDPDLDPDSDPDRDPDVEDEAGERDDDRAGSGGRGKRGRKGGKASARSESRSDATTARGAGLKALAMKLDLTEPNDPADLDEADPVFAIDDGSDSDDDDPPPAKPGKKGAKTAPAPIKKAVAKAAQAPVKSKTPAKAIPVKALPAKAAPVKPAAKATPTKAAPAVHAPVKKQATKAAPVKHVAAKHPPAKALAKKSVPARKGVPARKSVPAKAGKAVAKKAAPAKAVKAAPAKGKAAPPKKSAPAAKKGKPAPAKPAKKPANRR